eukprot:COSAG01_NODE_3369_length_6183_cov_20.176857_4_plen_93_part_00
MVVAMGTHPSRAGLASTHLALHTGSVQLGRRGGGQLAAPGCMGRVGGEGAAIVLMQCRAVVLRPLQGVRAKPCSAVRQQSQHHSTNDDVTGD